MKKIIISVFLIIYSTQAWSERIWKSVNVADPTQPTGVSTYVGTMSESDLNSFMEHKELPKFIKISNLTIVEQTGSLKKVSDFPWGGGKFVMGNDVLVNVQNILSIQSINSGFTSELDQLHK